MGRHALAGIANVPLQSPVETPFSPNMGGELIVGTFITRTIISLVVSLLTNLNRKRQAIIVSPGFAAASHWQAKLPENLILRALAIAGLASLVMGVTSVALLAILGVSEMDAGLYNYLHAVYVGVVAMVVAYVAVTKALLPEALN